MLKSIQAFMLGMREFRYSMTSSVEDEFFMAYEWGREWAHRVTFRAYELND